MPRWILDPEEQNGLLARFLRYVRIDTQSDEQSTASPSTEKQRDLARVLVKELGELGCTNVFLSPSCHVYAISPSNLPDGDAGRAVPSIGFLAHLDTYPGTSGRDVKPQVIDAYAGGDIVLPATGERISAKSNPNLARCRGHRLVHTDGTTLLGGDDKAGIAVILTMLDWLARHPEFPHGPLCIGFTPDEEIGRGVDGFDLARFGARYAYTIDGSGLGEVEDETFSADSATVTITGHDVHPGQAKNVMINAVRVASAIVAALPVDALPETTEGRQPYLHPYQLDGDVGGVRLKLLVRAFTDKELVEREDVLRGVVREVGAHFPGARIDLEIKASYRNMRDHIAKDPKVIDHALLAARVQGIEPVRHPVRGGTDGSRLSAQGLLTPNVFAGVQSPHSVKEWVSVPWMAESVGVCLQLVTVWREASAPHPPR